MIMVEHLENRKKKQEVGKTCTFKVGNTAEGKQNIASLPPVVLRNVSNVFHLNGKICCTLVPWGRDNQR